MWKANWLKRQNSLEEENIINLQIETSTPEESLSINQIIEIDQSNNICPIDLEEENLPTTEKVSISPEDKQNDEITIGFVGIEKSRIKMK